MVSSKKLLISSFQLNVLKIKPIVIKLPDNLPYKLAGKLLELTGAMNGLKESNRLADLDLRALIAKEGFTTCPSDPCAYLKVDKNNPKLKCVITFTVDDGLIL